MDKLTLVVDTFRVALGWKETHEFKFNSTKKSVIKDLLQYLRRFDFEAYAAVIDKTQITETPNLAPGENLYYYVIKELLLKLKLTEPHIIIDGVADKKQIQKARTYLRQTLKQHGIEKCKIGFADSRKQSMVQVADIIAGAVARSFDKNKADHDEYVKILKPKIKGIYKIKP
ncbi:DUF3800 domain-containing protein [Candidatus Saccharibacteria bacterium]|nr:DUF3800 domain-containing protein [Candidatus Saccharibacteria bacterium]